MIPRKYKLHEKITKNKAIIIYSPRRVGKTTLLNNFLKHTNLKYKLSNGDNIKIQELFKSQDFDKIKEYAEGYNLIAIDEA